MSRIDEQNTAPRLEEADSAQPRLSSGVRARVARSNLDPSPPRLIGRQGEIDAILQLLGRERQVTLLGSAGIGKTRVAREVAGRVLSTVADGGVWIVPLRGASSVEGIACAVARALDVKVPEDGGEDLLAQVGAIL